jgi:hypothetical protein
VTACTSVGVPTPGTSPTLDQSNLGGEWEWRDDATVQRIVLDKNGNGTYQWQNGRIVTTSVTDGRWEGIWSQEGNDREGGFEVLLTPNGSDAEGRWWYTRIGAHTIPAREQGGDFQMRWLSSVVAQPSS